MLKRYLMPQEGYTCYNFLIMHRLVLAFFKQRPGLVLLGLLLVVIWAVTIKPQFYLLGWDNFSSYFNLHTNIFRTFFATWRGYRGFGVPSDSESTDLFRQLFYLALSPFVSETILDQLYLLTACTVGLLAMYSLAYSIIGHYLKKAGWYQDVGGFFAAFFYLCNLNTLATFYFPMIMYVNRFFSLPLLFLIFFVLLTRPKVSHMMYVFICLAIFFISGSYITATIFITVVIALFCFGIFQKNAKRFLLIFLFYVLLNSFWLAPFTNYVIQKASIIRLAPNFIEANEVQLNKGKGSFDFIKQLVLYNSFFDTQFTDSTGKNTLYFHPIRELYSKPLYKFLLFIFPLFYLIGFFCILKRPKTHRELLWIPSIFIVFLFLTLKEFSPLGFIYTFLDRLTPYFGVLFRFGDTKFHAFLAFSGSISAGIGVVYILSVFSFFKKKWVLLFFSCLILFVFRFYFIGNFIGYFIYNKLPNPYVAIANTINKDQDTFRALHLPMNNNAYWKSYSWGAFGSSFLHFMLDKPFIDKTFEPASMENAYLHKHIGLLLANIQFLRSTEEENRRAIAFAALLKKTGVKYIIFDDSVKTAVYSRGITLWGDFGNEDTRVMLGHLVRLGLASQAHAYDIDLAAYAQGYKEALANNSSAKIYLYTLRDYQQEISFLPKAMSVDSKLTNLLETGLGVSDNHWVQKQGENGTIFPFLRRNATIEEKKNIFSFTVDQSVTPQGIKPLTLSVPKTTGSRDSAISYVAVYEKEEQKQIVVTFYLVNSPDFAQKQMQKLGELAIPRKSITLKNNQVTDISDYISDWSVLPQSKIGNSRLRIGDYVMPLPAVSGAENTYVGTIAVQGSSVPVDFLILEKNSPIDLSSYVLPQDVNCFQDKLQGASYSIGNTPFRLTSQNQSTCLFYDLQNVLLKNVAFAEVNLNLFGDSQNLDDQFGSTFSQNAKPILSQTVRNLPKQNALRLCAKEPLIDSCYNLHQLVNVSGNTHVVFPLEKPLLGNTAMQLLLSLKNSGYQKQELTIQDMSVSQFVSVAKTTLVIPNEQFHTTIFTTDKTLQFDLPKALSRYSFFFNPKKEGLYGYNAPCGQNGYRTVRTIHGALLSYIDNCYIGFFQDLPFSSSNFSLWTLSYNLASGKFPRFSIKDTVHLYSNEYTSLYQGYPDVTGFKMFQKSEQWGEKNIQDKLVSLPLQIAYGYTNPSIFPFDTGAKQLTVSQDSENEGLLVVNGFSIQPLPTNWIDMTISGDNKEEVFKSPENYQYWQILPSLWKTTVGFPQKGEYMMLFNEGFDMQWKLYPNLFGVVFGFFGGETPSRCDGYANCFVINQQDASTKTFYIFYTPERLSILGWGITILALFVMTKFFLAYGTSTNYSQEEK